MNEPATITEVLGTTKQPLCDRCLADLAAMPPEEVKVAIFAHCRDFARSYANCRRCGQSRIVTHQQRSRPMRRLPTKERRARRPESMTVTGLAWWQTEHLLAVYEGLFGALDPIARRRILSASSAEIPEALTPMERAA